MMDDNGPNLNMFRLERAENAASQAVQALSEIETGGIKEYDDLKYQSISDIVEVQTGSLLALRRAIEGG